MYQALDYLLISDQWTTDEKWTRQLYVVSRRMVVATANCSRMVGGRDRYSRWTDALMRSQIVIQCRQKNMHANFDGCNRISAAGTIFFHWVGRYDMNRKMAKYFRTVWPRTTKFGIVTHVGEGRVSATPIPRGGAQRPQTFWDPYWR